MHHEASDLVYREARIAQGELPQGWLVPAESQDADSEPQIASADRQRTQELKRQCSQVRGPMLFEVLRWEPATHRVHRFRLNHVWSASSVVVELVPLLAPVHVSKMDARPSRL